MKKRKTSYRRFNDWADRNKLPHDMTKNLNTCPRCTAWSGWQAGQRAAKRTRSKIV